MDLKLESQEVDVLGRLLTNELGQLRARIYHTENAEWRKGLHEDEATIKDLLTRLGYPIETEFHGPIAV